MRFFRSPVAVMALFVVGIAAGWKPVEQKAAPAAVADCCAADRGAARCCTTACSTTCSATCRAACTTACTAACTATCTATCGATPPTTRARRSPPASAVLVSAPIARRVTDYPDSPTGRAAEALVELTWTTGPDALREFVQARLTPDSRDRNSDETLLAAFGQIRDHVTQAELQSAKRTGPLAAELVLASERNGTQMTLNIDLEPDPPHRIDRLRGEGGAPDNAAGPQCATPADAGNVNALGVATAAPTPDIAATMKLAHRVRTEGRVVTEIEPDSPADRAGLEQGDVILQLADNRLYSADDITDYLAITATVEPIDVIVRRAGSTDDEQIRITPVHRAPTVSGRAGIDWQYAGLAQLDEALGRARASGKPVLVGLTGSDTCCPFSRFEVDSLSAIVDDPQIVEGSRDFVRIIIRRPHAYWFLFELDGEEEPRNVSATPDGVVINDGDLLPIPSFFFIDTDHNVLGNVGLAQSDALGKTLGLMKDLR